MKENLVETIEMKNGLILEIFDLSRNIAEDTCIVKVIFKIEIGIDEKLFKKKPDISDYNNIKARLGEKVEYEVKYERNFIKKESKEDVFNEVKNSFLGTNLKYLSHDNFAEKYIMRQFIK